MTRPVYRARYANDYLNLAQVIESLTLAQRENEDRLAFLETMRDCLAPLAGKLVNKSFATRLAKALPEWRISMTVEKATGYSFGVASLYAWNGTTIEYGNHYHVQIARSESPKLGAELRYAAGGHDETIAYQRERIAEIRGAIIGARENVREYNRALNEFAAAAEQFHAVRYYLFS